MSAQASGKKIFAAAAALLLGSIALGCDWVLGVEGLETGCTEGEQRCTGNTREICGASYVWQKTDCGDLGQTCLVDPVTGVVACVGECAPGKRCRGNTPQTCNAVGQWEGSTPCNAGESCTGGTCNCIQGDRRCFENRPQLCNASNQWENDGPPCMGQTCDPDVAACVGVCEPSQTQCLDANTSQHCDSKGQWQTTLKGICQGQCTFGAKRCAGNWPQTCDSVGLWQPLVQPCALGESCYQGQCQAMCTPGTKRCAGDAPQTCDANGQWQADGPACGVCIACDHAMGICESNPMPLDVCTEPLAIEAGEWHTCALFPNGKVKCWGYNDSGQLGLGDTNHRGDQPGEMGASLPFVDLGLGPGVTVVEISVGAFHTCARTSDGRVKCWGRNQFGQLGLGETKYLGDEPNEMGANLLFVDLGLDPGVTVAEISAGSGHTCARTSDGRLKCWGFNIYGELGLGNPFNRGDEPNEMGTNLPFVDLGLDPGVTVAQISAGYHHTCALSSDGRVKCWGNNGSGELGLGAWDARGDQPNEMGANLLFVDLGLNPGVTVAEISAGSFHTCALSSDGRVKCWGSNFFGQLGLGDQNDRGSGPNEMGAKLFFVDLGLGLTATLIRAGGHHTCALLSGGSVKCWGNNYFGQLGLGDTSRRGDEPNEMGDSLPTLDF